MDGDIFRRMASLHMLSAVALTYIFKFKNLKCRYLANSESCCKNASYDFYLPPNGNIVNVTLRDLDLHFQSQMFSFEICYKKYADSGCLLQTCLDSYGPRREVALVYMPEALCLQMKKNIYIYVYTICF